MKRRTSAIPQPTISAATKKNRILGMATRNINMLPMANKAPAMPVPPGIFETLICGVGVPSLILHPPVGSLSQLAYKLRHGLIPERFDDQRDRGQACARAWTAEAYSDSSQIL
jgi:hypothetical protein